MIFHHDADIPPFGCETTAVARHAFIQYRATGPSWWEIWTSTHVPESARLTAVASRLTRLYMTMCSWGLIRILHCFHSSSSSGAMDIWHSTICPSYAVGPSPKKTSTDDAKSQRIINTRRGTGATKLGIEWLQLELCVSFWQWQWQLLRTINIGWRRCQKSDKDATWRAYQCETLTTSSLVYSLNI